MAGKKTAEGHRTGRRDRRETAGKARTCSGHFEAFINTTVWPGK